MLKLHRIILILASLAVISCESKESSPEADSLHSALLLDYQSNFNYPFHDRANSDDMEIHYFETKVKDISNDSIVHEAQFYIDPWGEIELPDTLVIPDLAPGNYVLFASTTSIYTTFEEDELVGYTAVLDANDTPILVGTTEFSIANEDVTLSVDMDNISAKMIVNFTLPSPSSDLDVFGLFSPFDYQHYSFDEDELFTGQSNGGGFEFYSFDPLVSTTEMYFLPHSLNNYQFIIDEGDNRLLEEELIFDEDIICETGDIVTLNLVVDEQYQLTWDVQQESH